MTVQPDKDPSDIEDLVKQIQSLEQRVRKLEEEMKEPSESFVSMRSRRNYHVEVGENADEEEEAGSWLESRFGEYGLAWLGNLVLLIGIIFLMQHQRNLGHPYISTILGYFTVATVFLLSYVLRNTYSYLARMFMINGQLLVYYVTLRLHFFAPDPLLASKSLSLSLLMVIVAGQAFLALRQGSRVTGAITLVLAVITGIVSDSTHFMLPLFTLVATTALYAMFRYGWWQTAILGVITVYLGFLTWIVHNPFMGHPIEAITDHQYGFVYLFATGAIFSLAALAKQKENYPENLVMSIVILNGLGFSFLLLLFVLAFFKTGFIGIFTLIAAYCLGYSVILQFRSPWKFAPAFYSLYGFLAMSIAVYGIYDLPRAYWLLSLQSLLVVSMALWFRNKIIVIMNTFLFVSLLAVYIFSSLPVDVVNISFALVALATARVLNWKKGRLEIKTDLLRNTYLFMAFIMVLFSLYHIVPGNFVTLSWTIAAVLYFVLSLLIRNVKYRYLALGTMVAAAFYLFIVDLSKIGLVYRIMALMFLSIISIAISVYYTRRVKKVRQEQ